MIGATDSRVETAAGALYAALLEARSYVYSASQGDPVKLTAETVLIAHRRLERIDGALADWADLAEAPSA